MSYLLISTIIISLFAICNFFRLKRLFFPKNKIADMQKEIDTLRTTLEAKDSDNSNLNKSSSEQLSKLADFNANYWSDS